MSDSPLIILDEPTTGLDPLALTSLKQLILQERDKGKTILITSHIMSFIEEMADEVVFLLEGNIFFNGTIDSLMKQTKARNLELAISTIIQNSND
jgi:Cu-processing system ATP-binding protein